MENNTRLYNELFTALAKAQAEIKPAGLNAENPFFKSSYADFNEIIRVSRPALTKHGLCVLQQTEVMNDGSTVLKTILGHSSGQYIEATMKLNPTKTDVQALASYMTYVKRYCYAALVGVVTSSEDDDGENSMQFERNNGQKANQSEPIITMEQLDQLEFELEGHPMIAKQVLDGLKIKTLADMPRSKFMASINRIRDIKNSQKGI